MSENGCLYPYLTIASCRDPLLGHSVGLRVGLLARLPPPQSSTKQLPAPRDLRIPCRNHHSSAFRCVRLIDGAAKQYTDFGSDVRGLAQSLDILSDVVAKAQNSLHQQGPPNALVRWDPVSLGAIVGDYQATLAECHKLIDDNYRYNTGRSAVYSITWNALLQPAVDTLRQRIQLHNSKLLLVLKPFEM